MVLINKLTSWQESSIPEICNQWIQIGYSARTDSVEAERAIDEIYNSIGLSQPIKVWFNSPFEGCLGSWLLGQITSKLCTESWEQAKTSYKTHIKPLCWEHFEQQLMSQDWENQWEQIKIVASGHIGGWLANHIKEDSIEKVESQVTTEVWEQIWGEVFSIVYEKTNRILACISGAVTDEIHEQALSSQAISILREQVSRSLKHDLATLAFYYTWNHYGIDLSLLNSFWRLAQVTGWCWFYEGVTIMSPKPSQILFEEAGIIHADDRPAISYTNSIFNVWIRNGERITSLSNSDKFKHIPALEPGVKSSNLIDNLFTLTDREMIRIGWRAEEGR